VGVVAGTVLALNRSQQTLITPTNSVSAHNANAAGPGGGTAEVASLRPWEPLGLKLGPAAVGTSQQHGTPHTLVPAVACSANPSPSPSTRVAAASAAPTPTPTPTPTDTAPATPTATPSVTPTPLVTPTPTDSGVGTNGSEATQATQATQAAFIIRDGAQAPASTSCGGTSAVKVTPKSSPTPTATS
jgi:hypothetical protein